MGEFFRFLIDKGHIQPEFIFESFYSNTNLLPIEYYIENLDNFDNIYKRFAAEYTSGIMYNDLELSAIKESINYYNSCDFVETNCNLETNRAYDNQYIAEISNEGTIGLTPIEFISLGIPADYVTPIEKNEAWSWTVIKINTTEEKTFTVDFLPDERGNEGTLSNFSLYLTNREDNLVQEVDFNGEISVSPNLDYFLVMVNTPQKFEGWETFNYLIKITPND